MGAAAACGRVAHPGELRAAIDAAMREAETAFGDPTVFLEEAVDGARHIEVQVLGDGVGDIVHLYERDCSVQRRHQKVVEIAPGAQPRARDQRSVCARTPSRSPARSGYLNAGTVEFLVSPSRAGTSSSR